MPFTSSFVRKSGLTSLLALVVLLIAAAYVGQSEPSAFAGMDTLTTTGSMHMPRSGHTATLLPDGRVLITGGFVGQSEEENALTLTELYDPAQGVFTKTGPLTTGRQSHSATRLPDGKVLIAGGYDGTYLASAELYDPSTGAFTPTGSLSVGRIAHRATLLDDGKVLITGGLGGNGTFLASAEVYDSATGRFTSAGTMTTERVGHTQTRLTDGTVLIAGGRRQARRVVAGAERYDPVAGTFSTIGSMTIMRHKHAAVLMEDERVLIVGGSDGEDWRGRYDSAEIFDPYTGAFTETGRLNTARFKLRTAVTLLTDGMVLVAGGADILELYDPETERFTPIPGRLDTARFFSTGTLMSDGSVLITGGYDQKIQSTARAWRYHP